MPCAPASALVQSAEIRNASTRWRSAGRADVGSPLCASIETQWSSVAVVSDACPTRARTSPAWPVEQPPRQSATAAMQQAPMSRDDRFGGTFHRRLPRPTRPSLGACLLALCVQVGAFVAQRQPAGAAHAVVGLDVVAERASAVVVMYRCALKLRTKRIDFWHRGLPFWPERWRLITICAGFVPVTACFRPADDAARSTKSDWGTAISC